MPCPLCGHPSSLYDDGDLLDPDLPPLDCTNCFWEGTPAELEELVEESCRRWWSSLDHFMHDVMECPSARLALTRVAKPLLRAKMAPAVVLEILLRLNETLDARALAVEVEAIAVQAADEVSAELQNAQPRSGQAEQGRLFGRPSVER